MECVILEFEERVLKRIKKGKDYKFIFNIMRKELSGSLVKKVSKS